MLRPLKNVVILKHLCQHILIGIFSEVWLAQDRPRQGDLLRPFGHQNSEDFTAVHKLHHAQDQKCGHAF